ncbi:MAG: tRNA lysidine(34) synthetase TilS [Micrococcales bacterium]|nr:tRNA lysidine(34) synthetase TilS [Micrococcales bacterium]
MPGPPPAVAATRTAVRDTLRDASRHPDGRLVLVACSGGPDSLALAAATGFVAPRLGWRAGAVVVDHGLQDGSAQVAARAADQCRGLGLDPVLVRQVAVGTDGGPEAAARTARYAALDAAAAALGADTVLLGHTLDDQAEQVLLALARGSGVRSLAGMPARRGLYLRPFLNLRRATTAAACAAADLTPWHDPTNASGPGRRTRVRTEVMPLLVDVLGPGVELALARTADQLRDVAEVLDGAATALLAEVRTDDGAVPVEALAQAPAAVRRAALRAMVVAAGSPTGSLGARHVAAVEALVVDWHGQGPVHLPGPVLARRDCGRLRVEPSATSAGPTGPGRTRPAPTDSRRNSSGRS